MAAVVLVAAAALAWEPGLLGDRRGPRAPTLRPVCRAAPSVTMREMKEVDWAEKLKRDLEMAADLALRGATVSGVLGQAQEAASAASKAAWAAMSEMEGAVKTAQDMAAKALQDRDFADQRAKVAERSEAETAKALEKTKTQLESARAELDQGRKEASEIVGQLDDAFEKAQDALSRTKEELRMQTEAAEAAEKEAAAKSTAGGRKKKKKGAGKKKK